MPKIMYDLETTPLTGATRTINETPNTFGKETLFAPKREFSLSLKKKTQTINMDTRSKNDMLWIYGLLFSAVGTVCFFTDFAQLTLGVFSFNATPFHMIIGLFGSPASEQVLFEESFRFLPVVASIMFMISFVVFIRKKDTTFDYVNIVLPTTAIALLSSILTWVWLLFRLMPLINDQSMDLMGVIPGFGAFTMLICSVGLSYVVMKRYRGLILTPKTKKTQAMPYFK